MKLNEMVEQVTTVISIKGHKVRVFNVCVIFFQTLHIKGNGYRGLWYLFLGCFFYCTIGKRLFRLLFFYELFSEKFFGGTLNLV